MEIVLAALIGRDEATEQIPHQVGLDQQIPAPGHLGGHDDAHELTADPVHADPVGVGIGVDGLPGFLAEDHPFFRGDADTTPFAELVLPEALIGLPDASDQPLFHILQAAHVIVNDAVAVHQQSVDGDVPADHILLGDIGVNDGNGMTAVLIGRVLPEGRDFVNAAVQDDADGSKTLALGDDVGKPLHHLTGNRVRGQIVIVGLVAQKQVAHRASHDIKLFSLGFKGVKQKNQILIHRFSP